MAIRPSAVKLYTWPQVAERHPWKVLLAGNGLSINVSKDFDYESLFEEAEKTAALTDEDRAIFELFGTKNFEIVLGKLRDSIQLGALLGRKTLTFRRRYRSVQSALGTAVRGVHLEWTEVPDDVLREIKRELARYRVVYTTSYDLLIYWSMGHQSHYDEFRDCFWGPGGSFDPDDCEVRAGGQPVYYMHGALHLIVDGSGNIRKLTQSDGGQTLLEQFGRQIPDDPEARPLLISEGSARDKLRAIEGNDYLAHVYETFRAEDRPLVIFGNKLGAEDRHLVDAINDDSERPVAVSIRKKDKKRMREEMATIAAKLETDALYFFDSSTHPLGSSQLRVRKRSPFRRFGSRTHRAKVPAA
jgi:hypothetical protein